MFEKKYLYASLLASVLLAIPWNFSFIGITLFLGFVPLFYIENEISKQKEKYRPVVFFNYAYITFILWNLFAFWWSVKASWVAIFPPLFINSFFMALVFLLFHLAKRNMHDRYAYASFPFFWLAFEYIHHHWFLAFPWLSLGNGINNIFFIQWYEYTGVLGGSLIAILFNLLFFKMLRLWLAFKEFKALVKQFIYLAFLIVVPLSISIYLYNKSFETTEKIKVAVIQPNINSYTEKYNIKRVMVNFDKLKDMTLSVKAEPDFFIAPETAIPRELEIIWEDNYSDSKALTTLRQILKEKYANSAYIVGANTFKKVNPAEETLPKASYDKYTNSYYIAYNTSLFFDTAFQIQKYHKSKLVIGVERMPFSNLFPWLEKLIVNFGGVSSSLGFDEKRTVFEGGNVKIATPVCYESAFGEFISEFVKNGAQVLFLITNDGWWGNTPGYRQHLKFSQIRAIENRRSIVRSANTGTSCVINPKGEIRNATDYGQQALIEDEVSLSNYTSFYSQTGDFIGRMALFFSVIFILYMLVQIKKKSEGELYS